MIIDVPLDLIYDNPFQGRSTYSDIDLLAADIAENYETFVETLGLMQLPAGRIIDAEGNYIDDDIYNRIIGDETVDEANNLTIGSKGFQVQLAYGHRRLRAFRLLEDQGKFPYDQGFMPMQVLQLYDEEMLDVAWSENQARANLTAIEKARMLDRKQKTHPSMTHDDIGKAWGLSRSSVSNLLRLLELPSELQTANRKGVISQRQSLALLPISKLDEQMEEGQRAKLNDVATEPTPARPALTPGALYAYVQDHPETTAETIRNEGEKIARLAGEAIPVAIATYHYKAGGQVRQTLCRGCSYSHGGRRKFCMDLPCLKAKKKFYASEQTKIVAKRLGYEYVVPEDPSLNRWPHRSLVKIHLNGGCTHMVVGWTEKREAARPEAPLYSDHPYITMTDRTIPNGVALGHVGEIEQDCIGEEAPTPLKKQELLLAGSPVAGQLPDEDQLEAWKNVYATTAARIETQIKAALAAESERLIPIEAQALLINFLRPEIREERDKWPKWIAHHLYERTHDFGREARAWTLSGRPRLMIENARKYLGRIGISTDSINIELASEAYYYLSYYYHIRENPIAIKAADIEDLRRMREILTELNIEKEYPSAAAAMAVAELDMEWWLETFHPPKYHAAVFGEAESIPN